MSQIGSLPDIKHFSTVHRIIVDHRSWEHFVKFRESFSRDDFLTMLKQHPFNSTDNADITFLYYIYLDPNDLYRDGHHSYERYLRTYKNKSGMLIIRIGTCSLFDDQTRETWLEEDKIEAKDLEEVCDLLHARFVRDLDDMESFFH